MRRRQPAAWSERQSPADGPVNVVDERTFGLVLDLEFHKATRLRYCFSVLCVAPDLNVDMTPDVFSRLARVAAQHLRAPDLVTRLDSSCLALLLIDADQRSLEGIVKRVQEALTLNGIPVTQHSNVTLSAGGACFPLTAQSSGEVVSQAVDMLTRAQRDGGNRLYVPA